jgi:hypothetical protein
MQTNVSDSASNAEQSTDSNHEVNASKFINAKKLHYTKCKDGLSKCKWWIYNSYEKQLSPLIPYYALSTKK